MLVRQSKNSFIRSTERYGYVTNQLTQFDRVYNSTGADFLREISREAKDVDEIVDHLLTIYEGVSREEIKKDFVDLYKTLPSIVLSILARRLKILKNKTWISLMPITIRRHSPLFTIKRQNKKLE